MTAHPGPSLRAPPPRPPGARSAPVRAPRRLPHRPAGRGRSPANSAELGGPARGPRPGSAANSPGAPAGPPGTPLACFLTCDTGLGAGGGGRSALLPFGTGGLLRGWVGEGILEERIRKGPGLATRHNTHSKSCRRPRAQTPSKYLLPKDKELAAGPVPPPKPPICTPPFPGPHPRAPHTRSQYTAGAQ